MNQIYRVQTTDSAENTRERVQIFQSTRDHKRVQRLEYRVFKVHTVHPVQSKESTEVPETKKHSTANLPPQVHPCLFNENK